MTRLFVFIALWLSPIAAAMAFLITYGEYTHHLNDRRLPLLHALRASAFTFVVFMVITLLAGFLLARFVLGG